jgi:hypothetical protein
MWAADFFATGLTPDCAPTPILELAVAPDKGALYNDKTVAGVTIK